VAVLVVMATSQAPAQRLNPGIFPATSSPYGQTYGQWAAAWEFVRGTSFHRRCLGIKGDFPTTFLPTFASKGRIYAFSPFLAVDAISLTISALVSCADLARQVQAPPLPPVFLDIFKFFFTY
jgi:hypothetical protein